jgi:O-antigen/teichoic acid export membrane protein
MHDARAARLSIWRRIRRDVVLLGAGSFGAVFAQLIFRSILIAILVPTEYGRLTLVLSIYNTVWLLGASGLPNGAARYIAAVAPAEDSAIVRSALRAGALPTILAAAVVAVASAVILDSWLAFIFGAIGLSCLVYAVIIAGILRGRGRIGSATLVMPVGGLSEVLLLGLLVASGLGVTAVGAFGVFCVGNVVGLAAALFFVMQSAPRQRSVVASGNKVTIAAPSTRELLGFSMWLGVAWAGIVFLPLVVRMAAVLDSYTVVAIVDVALVLLSIPLRMGSVVVSSVIPHATRALTSGEHGVTISRREHLIAIGPFVLAAIIVASTPLVGWLFDAVGRPEYAKSTVYLALALVAGPARVLYGLVEGVLVAHGESRFLAFNSLSTTVVASVAIVLAAALGSMVIGFSLFVVACWVIYICGLRRLRRLSEPYSLRYCAPATN